MGKAYSTNAALVEGLALEGAVATSRVRNCMLAVDRMNFSKSKEEAYNDNPHSIGYKATISAPHMHAHALSLLENVIQPGARVLDVGSGSGYLCSCFAELMRNEEGVVEGKIVGIDVIPELVEWAKANVERQNPELLENGTLRIEVGDGWEGYPELAPFDAIHVGAGAETLPKELVEQLAPGGRMVIPVGKGEQEFLQVDKDKDGVVTKKSLFGCRYVPLVKKQK